MSPEAEGNTEGNTDSTVSIVLSTAGSKDEADRIAHALVERRLAACVNMVPSARSVYRWKEQIEEAEEVILLIKTTGDKLAALEQALKTLHSYELPEFIVLAASGGSDSYLQWIRSSVR